VFGSETNGDEDHDQTLMRIYIRMAGALVEQGNLSEARANLGRSLAVAEGMVRKSPSSSSAKQYLFEAYNYMNMPLTGTEKFNLGDSKQAEANDRKALSLLEEMIAS